MKDIRDRSDRCIEVDVAEFVRQNTEISAPAHVPEIRLYLATEINPLWRKTENELEEIGLPPPFWAFAWAGGQGLARYILDNPQLVRGKSVIDFACGSGLVGIAAAMAGCRQVTCVDTDLFCRDAVRLNAALNGVAVNCMIANIVGNELSADAVLAGDVFYDRELAAQLSPWFSNLAEHGKTILVGDPGRSYLPNERLTELAVYEVPSSRELEDSEVKRTTVWRFS